MTDMTNKTEQTKVFSLLEWRWWEILWVVGVMLVVFFVSANQLVIGQMKSRDAQRRADVELVARALEAYYSDYQVYPEATESGQIVSCGSKGTRICVWGKDTIVDKDNIVYLKNLPSDPFAYTGQQYQYMTDEYRSSFKIYVRLEYLRDPVVKHNLTMKCGNNVQCNWFVENVI